MSFLSDFILLQFFKGLNITVDQKKILRKAFHTYYDAASELLQSEHTVRIFLYLLGQEFDPFPFVTDSFHLLFGLI